MRDMRYLIIGKLMSGWLSGNGDEGVEDIIGEVAYKQGYDNDWVEAVLRSEPESMLQCLEVIDNETLLTGYNAMCCQWFR